MANRHIRSFVRRDARITPGQARALNDLLPRYVIPDGIEPLSPAVLFRRSAALILEIGFGNGESLHTQAVLHPERDYLGVEIHRPGIGRLLNTLARDGLTNVRIACLDIIELLPRIPECSLDVVQIFFPDPWPKVRHHKRRLIQPTFIRSLHDRLKPGGYLHLATDWAEYAKHMQMVLAEAPSHWQPITDLERIPVRPQTKYEARGIRQNQPSHDLVYERMARRC